MPSTTTLTIATRQSALALWQARFVQEQLQTLHPHLTIRLLPLSTEGDETLNQSLYKIGGKGLFVKELESALLQKKADIAVHSLKDMPMALPDGLCLSVICERASPEDALLSLKTHTLQNLPQGAIVGSSSLRRQSQLLLIRPDLQLLSLRGNVNTRIQKLERGDFDAIVLAKAGIERLKIGLIYASILPIETCLPAAGQGALCIECLQDNVAIQALIQPLHHLESAQCVTAERAVVRYCEGSCQTPIAAYATIENNLLVVRARIAMAKGSPYVYNVLKGAPQDAETLGTTLGKMLRDNGGDAILKYYQ